MSRKTGPENHQGWQLWPILQNDREIRTPAEHTIILWHIAALFPMKVRSDSGAFPLDRQEISVNPPPDMVIGLNEPDRRHERVVTNLAH